MSLINDALRRSNQQKKEPTPAPSDGAPMQPVPQSQRPNASLFGPMVLIFFLGVVLTCAVWFLWKGFSTKPSVAPELSQTSTPAANVPRETAPAVPSQPIAIPSAPEKAVIQPSAPVAEQNDAIDNSASKVASVPENVPPVPPAPSVLKLQGIFFRISNPTALINGKTVGIGERVDGARVLKIERQEVTLERDGKTIVLALD